MSGTAASRFGAFLDRLPWPYQTDPCKALGFDFAVRVMDPQLGAYLDRILVHPDSPGDPLHLYSLVDRGPRVRSRYALFLDGVPVEQLTSPGIALAYLLWHVNQAVVEHTPDLLLLHASAVERDGVAVVMPAPMESGKTTLAAGLVQAGLRYVTDEAVAIDPVTLRVLPYPKALSVDPGSWNVLAALRPIVDEGLRPYLDRQWHVPPDSIRPGSVALASAARFIVSPRYEAGAITRLVPVRRSEALALMVDNSFNLSLHGQSGLDALAAVVRRSDCYRLTVSDLGQACRLIMGLLGREEEGRVAS